MTKRTLTTSLLFVLAIAPLGAQPDPGKEELKLKLLLAGVGLRTKGCDGQDEQQRGGEGALGH